MDPLVGKVVSIEAQDVFVDDGQPKAASYVVRVAGEGWTLDVDRVSAEQVRELPLLQEVLVGMKPSVPDPSAVLLALERLDTWDGPN